MTVLRIIGKLGSKACKDITSDTSLKKYRGNKNGKVDVIVNYGLAGKVLENFLSKYPSARKLPIINKHIGCPKYKAVKQAYEQGIKVPETKLELGREDIPNDWLIKRQHSIGGKGIKIATTKKHKNGIYYQKFISDRAYELRVHCFEWGNTTVQRRLGEDNTIAWNYKNGGRFQTVVNTQYKIFQEAIKVSYEVLKLRNMAFGAVDFLVDLNRNLYFIEINSSPGFTELSKPIYIEAFRSLEKLPKKEVLKLAL